MINRMADRELMQRDLQKTYQSEREYLRQLGKLALTSSLSSLSKAQFNISDRALNYERSNVLSDLEQEMSNHHHYHHRSTLERSPSDVTSSTKLFQERDKLTSTGVKLRKQESINGKHRVNTLDALGPSDLGKFDDKSYYTSGNETLKRYQNVIRKYENLKEEYEVLLKRYSDLVGSHSLIVSKLEISQEENSLLRKNYEDVIQERNFAIKDRNDLQQQSTYAIRNWDKAIRENNELKEQLAKVQQQRDDAMKEINQAMAVRIKATKDMARLTEERNAAVQEYNLIMSERDSVHKEIEKLQEELTDIQKRNKAFEAENKVLQEEVESLKREIASALTDRDRVLRVCNDLREKHSDYVTGINEEATSPTSPFRSLHSFFGSSSSGISSSWAQIMTKGLNGDIVKPNYISAASSSSSVSTFSHQTNKFNNANSEQSNVEVESMKKQLERLQIDLIDAQQEVEVCKKRRDWAFNERDKIVLERESIRKLCDKLRRERDRAVSDLAEALRDSDDIKKQRNDAIKELNEIKENSQDSKFKTGQIVGLNNTSRDSAIDTDMQEFDIEMINACMKRNINKVTDDWGFDLGSNQHGIFVSSVIKDSVADGKVKPNDYILKINGTNLINDVKLVQNILNSVDLNDEINMLIQRKKFNRGVHNVNIKVEDDQGHGIVLENGFYINKIINGSAAARRINIAVGDRVLCINGKSLDNYSIDEANQLLNSSNDILLQLMKNTNNSCSISPGVTSSSNSPVSELNDIKTQFRERQKKMVSCSSQTDDINFYTTQYQIITRNSEITRNPEITRNSEKRSSGIFGNKQNTQTGNSILSTLQKQISQPVHSTNILDKAYNKIFGEWRSSKQKQQTVSPYCDEEGKTIAELDRVLDIYSSGKSNSSGKSSTKSFNLIKLIKNSGGTWPKYQNNQTTEIMQEYGDVNAVTTLHPRKRKVRKSLNIFNIGNKNDKNDSSRIGADTIAESPTYDDEFKEEESTSFMSFESKQSPNPNKSLTLNSATSHFPFYHSYIKSNDKAHHKQSKSLIDPKIDYSVVSAQKDKHIMEYYKNRKGQNHQPRPHSIHDVLGDNVIKSQDHSSICDSADYHSFQSSTSSIGNSGSYYYAVSNVSNSQNNQQFPSDSIPQPPVRSSSNAHSMLSQFVSRSGDFLVSKNENLDGRESLHSRTLSSYQPNKISTNNYSPPYYTGFSNISPPNDTLPNDTPHRFLNNYLDSTNNSNNKNSDVFIDNNSGTTIDGLATIPKRNQRIRIPSNQSVNSKSSKLSTSSIEKYSTALLSERESPLPYAHIEWLSSSNGSNSDRKAKPMDIRSIYIEKNFEPLGIQISCDTGGNGGVFVSCVTPKSIAAQAGLMVGDQLLEVCGINMRTATYKLAANVLRQCGNSIRMLVQFNPEKYRTLQEADDGSSDESTDDTEDEANAESKESWAQSL